MELLGPSYYGVSGTLVDKYKREKKIWPSMCQYVTVGTGTSYHGIVLHRYSPVRATGITPEDTCSKAMKIPIIVQQGCNRPNDIKAERPNVWPYRKAMTGPIIVLCRYDPMMGPIIILHRYDPVQATQIMNEGACNNNVTSRITQRPKGQISGWTKCTML